MWVYMMVVGIIGFEYNCLCEWWRMMLSNVSDFIRNLRSDGSGINFSEKKEKKNRERKGMGMEWGGLFYFIKDIDHNKVSKWKGRKEKKKEKKKEKENEKKRILSSMVV